LAYLKSGKIEENSKNVVLLTGSGLKDLNAVKNIIKIPKPIEKLEEIDKILK
jgi:threonine synthase